MKYSKSIFCKFNILFLLFFAILVLTGCSEGENIARKIADNQVLTDEEIKIYEKNKEQIDAIAAFSHYTNPSENEISEGVRQYRDTLGGVSWYDITTEKCDPFGFMPGDKVLTPNGPGYVVGVANDDLYFHVEGRFGAERWQGYEKQKFLKNDFKLLAPAEKNTETEIDRKNIKKDNIDKSNEIAAVEKPMDDYKSEKTTPDNVENEYLKRASEIANNNPSKTYIPPIKPIE